MEITTKELGELLLASTPPTQPTVSRFDFSGTHIVALDLGWVFVGKVHSDGQFITIENARCIRYWGTTTGLGELRDGPTSKTKLDDAGTVVAPLRAVIHFIKCNRDW